jgi:hypothetical protein
MFLNALSRKKKADDVTEADAESMVAIHNNMNERTWAEVLRWESLHAAKCPDPKLLRFKGRPDELSPLARLRTLTGCVSVCVWGPVPVCATKPLALAGSDALAVYCRGRRGGGGTVRVNPAIHSVARHDGVPRDGSPDGSRV